MIKFYDIPIFSSSREELWTLLNQKQRIVTPNPEILLEARKNTDFKGALQGATLHLPDGHGLQFVSTLRVFKSRWLRAILFFPALALMFFWKKPFRHFVPELIHGSDFMAELVSWAAESDRSVFFLGAAPGIAKRTAQYFQEMHPALKVAGFSSKDPDHAALEEVLRAKPDLLFLAYGAPKQELWMQAYKNELSKIHLVIGVGGSFDFYAGEIKRAPLIMRKLGIEWMWRLLQQPIKRSKRIFNALFVFPFLALIWD